jgi:hypothetical protein
MTPTASAAGATCLIKVSVDGKANAPKDTKLENTSHISTCHEYYLGRDKSTGLLVCPACMSYYGFASIGEWEKLYGES